MKPFIYSKLSNLNLKVKIKTSDLIITDIDDTLADSPAFEYAKKYCLKKFIIPRL